MVVLLALRLLRSSCRLVFASGCGFGCVDFRVFGWIAFCWLLVLVFGFDFFVLWFSILVEVDFGGL